MSTPAAPTPGTNSPGSNYGAIFNIAYKASKPPAFWGFYGNTPDEIGANGQMRTDRWAGMPQLDPQQQWALFKQLLAQGWILDEEVEGEQLDPYSMHWFRQNEEGQTSEPAGQGDIQVTNINQPGAVVTQGEYSGPVTPAGIASQPWVVATSNGTLAIRVSIMLADYPAYPVATPTAPVAAPMQPLANPVGPLKIPSSINAMTQVGGLFATLVNSQGLDGYNEGDMWPKTGTGTAQGLTGQWEKIPGMMGMGAYWEKVA